MKTIINNYVFFVIIERKHCGENIFFSQIFVFLLTIWRIFLLNFTFSTHHEGKKFFPLTLLWATFPCMNAFKIPTATLVNDILSEKI